MGRLGKIQRSPGCGRGRESQTDHGGDHFPPNLAKRIVIRLSECWITKRALGKLGGKEGVLQTRVATQEWGGTDSQCLVARIQAIIDEVGGETFS